MDPVTMTAQTLGNAASISPNAMLALLVSVLLAVLMAPAVQASIEGAIATFLPGWAFFAKPFIPSAVAGAIAKLATMHGIPGVDAVGGAMALASAVHWVNEQTWAASMEGKHPKIWALILSALPSKPADGSGMPGRNVAMLVFLGLGLLGASLHADAVAPIPGWCAGPALWGGGSLYQTNGSGTLDPKQETLGGVEFAGYLGSWNGNEFAPTYTLGVIGAMSADGPISRPALGVTGGFYLGGVPMTVFAAKELTSDAGGVLWGLGTSVQFSGWVPFLYLGKPGN